MLNELLAPHTDLPDIWGEGALFAFSGLDGPTCTASGFVASFAREPYGLLIHTPRRRVLDLVSGQPAKARVATGDVLGVETPGGELLLAYSAWHTLLGVLPPGTRWRLRFEEDQAPSPCPLPPGERGNENGCAECVCEDPRGQDAIACASRAGQFALAYGRTREEAEARVRAGLKLDAPHEAARRLAFFTDPRVPPLPSPALARLLKKCLSVMKVNTLGPEPPFQQLWSTPDRVPHRDCWLWDSVFHALGMSRIYPAVAWDYLKAVLDSQRADGLIPIQSNVRGKASGVTQPPLLAWGVWEAYRALRDRAILEYALPRLTAYLEWNRRNRDQNGNGLLEWFIEGKARCRSGESGLDNSPRFDCVVLLDAVDFSVFQAHDLGHAARIARELERGAEAAGLARRAAELRARIHGLLWDDAAGLYVDRDFEGRLSPVQAVAGFMPLLLEDTPAERVARLVAALHDPQRFATAAPVPSVARNDPEFSSDMWRGPAWVNLNYLICVGLRKHGRGAEAAELAEQTIAMVLKYYERSGVLFEFYDATDAREPWACDRKGPRGEPYDVRRKFDSVRDYHWTAALTAALLLEGERK